MSRPLTDVEGKLLFDRLNRRAASLKSLRRNPSRSPWCQIPVRALFLLLGVALGVLWLQSDGSRLLLFAIVVGMLMITAIELLIGMTNSRIDMIIELLQQDGMLENPPTAYCEKRPREEPTEDRTN